MVTHALDWPTLTIQWLPDKETYITKSLLYSISSAIAYPGPFHFRTGPQTRTIQSTDCFSAPTPPTTSAISCRLPLSIYQSLLLISKRTPTTKTAVVRFFISITWDFLVPPLL